MISEQRSIRVSVETKFIPPSATKGARILVKTLSDMPIRRYYPYDYGAEGVRGAHIAAAEEFLNELEWNTPNNVWHVGVAEKGFIFVQEVKKS